jgi:hypothetical protein
LNFIFAKCKKKHLVKTFFAECKKKHSAKTFFVVRFFGTRQRSSLPSAKLKTLGKKRHSAKKILALGKEASLVPERKRSANHLALGKV